MVITILQYHLFKFMNIITYRYCTNDAANWLSDFALLGL